MQATVRLLGGLPEDLDLIFLAMPGKDLSLIDAIPCVRFKKARLTRQSSPKKAKWARPAALLQGLCRCSPDRFASAAFFLVALS